MAFSYEEFERKKSKIEEKISLLKNVMFEKDIQIREKENLKLPNNIQFPPNIEQKDFQLIYQLIGCSKYDSSVFGDVVVLYCNDYVFAYRLKYKDVDYWMPFLDFKKSVLSNELQCCIVDAIGQDDINLPGYHLIGYNGFEDDGDAIYMFDVDKCNELGLDSSSMEEIKYNLDVLGQINEIIEEVSYIY